MRVPSRPVLGEGCVLRPLDAGDLDLVLQAGWSDIPEWTFVPREPDPTTAQAWLDRDLAAMSAGTRVRFVIEAHDQPVGMVGGQYVDPGDPGIVESFYFIYPHHRRRGHATRALRSFDEWAVRTEPDLRRLQLHVIVGNPGSQGVAEAAGYAHEGIAVARIPAVNGFPIRDAHVHAHPSA